MQRTISRLFDSRTQAEAAVRDLEAAGIPDSDISLVARHAGEGRSFAADETKAGEGAAKGAATGGAIGAGAGLIAGLGLLAIPGLGPVVAAGWLASAAVGAVTGAAAGGAAGGLLGALKHAGVDDADANVYAEGVRRGGTLVAVRADEAQLAGVESILNRNSGIDATTRGALYRQEGWTNYEDDPAIGAKKTYRGAESTRPI
jgi:hypothetical protein